MNFKTCLKLCLLLTLSSSPALFAEETKGPELNFEKEEKTQEKSEEKKSLLQFGNEKNSLKIGGYGSMRFEYGSAKNLDSTFTLRRLVLTTEAKIESRFRLS